MDDHYFETKLGSSDGAEHPPERFHTVQAALSHVLGYPDGVSVSIWYHGDPDAEPVEVMRCSEDGTWVDVRNDDGTNYPLNGVPDTIEPGALMFSLWLADPDGRRTAYDFGFDWDGENQARWQCGRGDNALPGTPWYRGVIRWSSEYVTWIDSDEESEPDVLGNDLWVTFVSSAEAGPAGEVVLTNAAVQEPFSLDAWVDAAEELFHYFRGIGLI